PDVFGVGGRYGLAEFGQGHPVDVHGLALHGQRDAPYADLDGAAKVGAVRGRREPWRLPAVVTRRLVDHEAAQLEVAMAPHVEYERAPAEHDRVAEWCASDVLDDRRQARPGEQSARRLDEVRVAV